MPRSPVPQGVSEELQRVVRRWHQLPLDHALSCVRPVRLVLDELAGSGAGPAGPVPDLGPAVVMDQLTVLVYDACEAGADADHLTERLADLRRALA